MTKHPADGCPRCRAAAERARAVQQTAWARAITADPDGFFAAHPEVVTAAHAYVENQRRDRPVWPPAVGRGAS